jgi:UDP:flavonoid glycosyltransferase YjiC (YdhE family)
MRILFGATPAPGHLLPLFPLADAAAESGHEVAFLTADTMAPFLLHSTLLPAGPGIERLFAEAATRSTDDALHPGEGAAELFAGARVDLTWDEALSAARVFEPDLLVGEWVDFVTPLLAAQLGVAWVAHSIGGPLPVEFTDAMVRRSGQQHRQRGLTPRSRLALLDPFPVVLRGPVDPPLESDRIEIRPVAHRHPVLGPSTGASVPPAGDRPLVLVTTGTSVGDVDLFGALATSLVEAGAEVLVTASAHPHLERPHVHPIGFVPLADVLPRVDVVVGAAGSGTLLATLANGVPSILLPRIADQPANAARAAGQHAALVIEAPEDAGRALSTLLADDRYRAGARQLRDVIATMNSPEQALKDVASTVEGKA